MGRKPKQGLDYFPKDVDYYDDFKIMDLINEYGPLGQTIYDIIICMIYHEGYYLEVSLDKLAMKIVRTVGNRWVKDKNLVLQVIQYCADIDLFNNDLLNQSVITSVGIQKRYSEVTVRNKVDKEKYWLSEKGAQSVLNELKSPISVTKTTISATEITINATSNPLKESKVNKSKLKDIKSECFFESDDMNASFEKFIEYRKEKNKKPVPLTTINTLVAKLNNNFSNDKERIQSIEQSIERGWTGLFEVKSAKAIGNNKFNNFDGRSYDIDNLEKHLLQADMKGVAHEKG